ncbi:MAG: hypothetical protein PHO29_11365 [Acetobacterium sp.]|nr:hypothetical protein [Acetobacterium sp.]
MALVKKVVTRRNCNPLSSIETTLREFRSKIIELRAVDSNLEVVSGCFKDVSEIRKCLEQYEGKSNVYFRMNKLNRNFGGLCSNRLSSNGGMTRNNEDIDSYQYLKINLEAIRPDGVSATDAEKKEAENLREDVKSYLLKLGFPEPYVADTGNGYDLLIPVGLRNTPKNVDLMKNCLESLDHQFSTDTAKVDRTTYEPAGFTRLYGTMACIGENTEERPHRQSKLLSIPETRENASIEQLQLLADCQFDVTREISQLEVKSLNKPELDDKSGIDEEPTVDDKSGIDEEPTIDDKSGIDEEPTIDDKSGIDEEPTVDDKSGIDEEPTVDDKSGIDEEPTVDDKSGIDEEPTVDDKSGIDEETTVDDKSGIDEEPTVDDKSGIDEEPTVDDKSGIDEEPTVDDKSGIDEEPTVDDKSGIDEKKSGREKQSSVIIEALSECEFFHDWEDEAYAVVPSGNHREILKISGKKFGQFLKQQYYLKKKSAPGKDAINEALEIAEMKAIFEGEERILEKRVAMTKDDEIFYDLADSEGRIVKINQYECVVINDPSVSFIRKASMKPQVVPDLEVQPVQLVVLIKKYLRITREGDVYLFVIYLITCFIKNMPHPILLVHGEKGAAKSTIMKLIKRIVDPCVQDLLAIPNAIDDLSLVLNNHYLPSFDNVGSLSAEQANLLCMAVTGGRRPKRKNYTDDDEVFYDLMNCVQISGINIPSSQPDFLDRAITIEQERIKADERMTEKKFWEAFEQDKPKILGAIFNTLKATIPIFQTVDLDEVGRLADFTEWGYAVGQALGDKGELFLEAYLKNQSIINEEALLTNPVSATLVAMMRDKESWSGTMTNLLSELEETANLESINIRRNIWPADASALSKRLKEVKSNLEEYGIYYEQRRSNQSRIITVTNNQPASSEEETD